MVNTKFKSGRPGKKGQQQKQTMFEKMNSVLVAKIAKVEIEADDGDDMIAKNHASSVQFNRSDFIYGNYTAPSKVMNVKPGVELTEAKLSFLVLI